MERPTSPESASHKAPLLVESEHRVRLLLDYAACYEKYGEPDTWGATPSSISESLNNQSVLINKFARRLVVPNNLKEVDPSNEAYMEHIFLKRFIDRCIANDENYIRALSPNPFAEADNDRPEKLKSIEYRAKVGLASPAEILALQGIHGIGAVELASLTHPYGANIEYLGDMRAAVNSSVKLFGGEVFAEPEVHFSISDVINRDAFKTMNPADYDLLPKTEKIERRESLGDITGLLMTRKRTVGRLPDGTVIRERTSFVLTQQSGLLTDDILQQFSATPECPHWGREAVRQVAGLDLYISGLLNKDEFLKVIPVSSTMYAFNKERLEEIDQAIASYTEQNTTGLDAHAMHNELRWLAAQQLYKAGTEGRNGHSLAAPYEERNGMAFFGRNSAYSAQS